MQIWGVQLTVNVLPQSRGNEVTSVSHGFCHVTVFDWIHLYWALPRAFRNRAEFLLILLWDYWRRIFWSGHLILKQQSSAYDIKASSFLHRHVTSPSFHFDFFLHTIIHCLSQGEWKTGPLIDTNIKSLFSMNTNEIEKKLLTCLSRSSATRESTLTIMWAGHCVSLRPGLLLRPSTSLWTCPPCPAWVQTTSSGSAALKASPCSEWYLI